MTCPIRTSKGRMRRAGSQGPRLLRSWYPRPSGHLFRLTARNRTTSPHRSPPGHPLAPFVCCVPTPLLFLLSPWSSLEPRPQNRPMYLGRYPRKKKKYWGADRGWNRGESDAFGGRMPRRPRLGASYRSKNERMAGQGALGESVQDKVITDPFYKSRLLPLGNSCACVILRREWFP